VLLKFFNILRVPRRAPRTARKLDSRWIPPGITSNQESIQASRGLAALDTFFNCERRGVARRGEAGRGGIERGDVASVDQRDR